MKTLIFTLTLFFVSHLFSQVGIVIENPTEQLDIANGTIKVRDIQSLQGNVNDKFVVADVDGTFRSIPSQVIVGDIKAGVQATDHEGWVLLDGRTISSLTTTQQAAANSLNLLTNLPDASNSYLVQNGQEPDPAQIANGPSVTFLAANNIEGGGQEATSTSTNTRAYQAPHNHNLTTSSVNGGVTQETLNNTP